MIFLTNCISEQYDGLFNTRELWSILAHLSKNVYLKHFIRKKVSLETERTPENHQSLRNLLYLQISLINHLSHLIKLKILYRNHHAARDQFFGAVHKEKGFSERDGEIFESLNFHESSQGWASFNERDARPNSNQNHLDSITFPENFRCLEYIIHITDVLASWKPILRKRECGSKVHIAAHA